MAFRTWAKLLGAAVGGAALAGAGQLGLAYGLGILRLTRVVEVTARDQWTAQLAWVAWIAVTAAAIGGLIGQARLPRHAGAGSRIVAAVAAGAGGAVVVPLTMQPARTAQVAGVHPVFVIGICAGLAALAGIFAAYATLSRAVARWSVTTIGIAIWVIAFASVAPSLAPGDELPAVRLGVFDAAFLAPSVTQRIALLTMPILALLSGVVLGLVARARSLSLLNIALAGLPGPALLTVAYLIAGPGSGSDRYEVVPYWAAMTAAGAGVLGSVLAAVLRRGPVTDESPSGDVPPAEKPAPDKKDKKDRKARGKGGPTPDRPPLPRRAAKPSAIARAAAGRARAPEPRPADTAVFSIKEVPPFDGFTPPSKGVRPEPTPISPPLPNPQPVTPIPPVTPPFAPPASPPPPDQRARGRRQQADGEFVDWVSGLGHG
jgi:hypothetical protein